MKETPASRRHFLTTGLSAIPAVVTLGLPVTATAATKSAEADVSPAEDLMREHGALNRILLIYDEARLRLENGKSVDPQVISQSAELIRAFIENYHEKLEENHLFPRFEKANKLTDLVAVLRKQHEAGRELTSQIISDSPSIKTRARELASALSAFNRMYRPHEAREDTILFPAFRQLVTEHEYAELGEQFEEQEHRLFGKEGFEQIVAKIATLEKQLGIYDLTQFTPQPKK